MDLNEIAVFVRVVQAGSFIAAAKALGMPKSTVSKKVGDLEERLGTRMLQRTTRKLSLTDAGRLYYDQVARLLDEVEDAERVVTSLRQAPRGLLRVTAGRITSYLGPIVRDYMERYPDVRIELYCTERAVDLVEERFDLGIRAGRLPDSTLIARSLGSVPWHLVATPAYLERRGRPRSPADLARHDCLLFGFGADRATLRFHRGEERVELEVPTRLMVYEVDILRSVAAGGLGIALLPAHVCYEDLRTGQFERVLREWELPKTPIQIVYPSTRHMSPKVQSFIAHLQEHLSPPPWELGA